MKKNNPVQPHTPRQEVTVSLDNEKVTVFFEPETKNELFEELGEDRAKEIYYKAREGDRKIIRTLHELIKQYPHIPYLKNHLYIALFRRGQQKSAMKVLRRTLKEHPEYLFARTGLAQHLIDEGEFDEIPKLLGENLSLRDLYPERERFHVSEFTAYNTVVGMYEAKNGEPDRADKRLELILKVDEEHPLADALGMAILKGRLGTATKRMRESQEMRIAVDSHPLIEFTPIQRETPPALHHPILEQLYEYAPDELPEALVKEILNLERTTLITDLEAIVRDAIDRYGWYFDGYVEFDKSEQSFMINAMYFLAAIEATDSLEKVLDMLRMGEEFLDYWFSDYLDKLFTPVIYTLGKDQLPQLKDFVLTPHLFSYARLTVVDAVEQIAYHHPERRQEVVDWIGEILQYHLDHPDNEGLIDTTLISMTAAAFTELQSTRSDQAHTLITQLGEQGWIIPFIAGDVDSMLAQAKEPLQPLRKNPLPESAEEFFTNAHQERYELEKANLIAEEREEREDTQFGTKDFLMNLMISGRREHEKEEGIASSSPATPKKVSSGKKVGRNEPCPCGSGKKYKKCCMD